MFLPRGVLGNGIQPGPNDRIGVGFIGVGRQGSGLLSSLPASGRVVAVADVYQPRAESIAAKYNVKAFTDYRRLLDLPEVQAVVVATPDHWRALVCIHACQAGKDIYAEKPLTLTIREGRLLVEAVRKYGRVLQTGSQQRSDPANRLGCQLVREGNIGKVHTVIAHNYPSPWHCGLPAEPVPEGLDWDRWCGPTVVVPFHRDIFTPRANPGWISFRPWSGGEVTGWGSHGLDQIQWALGTDETGPVEIWTEGGKFAPPTYTHPESRARGEKLCSVPKVCYRYANGVVVRLENGPPGGAIFRGELGTMTIDRGRYVVEPRDLVEQPEGKGPARIDVHMQNWLDCIRSRQRPAADVEIGHRTATICHLINIARELGRPLRWDPVKEQFIDDPEANGLLDRSRRAPYTLPEKI
jgi:predicted dehydrogenase